MKNQSVSRVASLFGYKHLTRNVLLALLLGLALGVTVPDCGPWVAWMGRVFKAMLAMIVMPVVFTSIISGMDSIGDIGNLGQLGSRTVFYYLLTTFLAIFLGLGLVSTMQPGVRPADPVVVQALNQIPIASLQEAPRQLAYAIDGFVPEVHRQKIHEDVENSLTHLVKGGSSIETLRHAAARLLSAIEFRALLSDSDRLRPITTMSMSEFLLTQINKAFMNPFEALANMNVLAVIIFALFLGAALATIGPIGVQILEINRGLNLATMKMVQVVMTFAPFGVFGLIVDVVSTTGASVLRDVGMYVVCVLAGLAIHMFGVLPALTYLLSGFSPIRFFRAMRPALFVAFSTSSSNATLPVNLECVEDGLGVDKRISRFVLPLGATVNMNGTALYEAVAAVFIAQLYGVTVGFSSQFMIAITAALAAIGTAGIPAAGTVTMALVLSAAGLPLEGIGLLLAVERPLDMCRTVVNVVGDAFVSVILQKQLKDKLDA